MKRAINRFIKQARTEHRLSENTIQGYREDLRKFAAFLSDHYGKDLFPGDVTPEMVQQYMEFLSSTGYGFCTVPRSYANSVSLKAQRAIRSNGSDGRRSVR